MAKNPIQEIAKRAGEAGIPFLIIGGHAVFAHGYVRTTEDLDLLVPRGQRADWSRLLSGLGMSVKNDAATFLQFKPKEDGGMEVDLMFVSEDVFERLEQASVDAKVEGTNVRVVALLHLVALKCHALQHSKALRRLKDMDDLIQLILINRLDLNEPELRAIILKHGNAEIYEKLRFACVPMNEGVLRDAPGLEFPDWNGMRPHRSRKTFEEAVRWNDEMRSLFRPVKKSPELEADRRCHAEFVL